MANESCPAHSWDFNKIFLKLLAKLVENPECSVCGCCFLAASNERGAHVKSPMALLSDHATVACCSLGIQYGSRCSRVKHRTFC